jgi:hypothetical protein
MVERPRANSSANSGTETPASYFAMIACLSGGVRLGFLLEFPLITVPNEPQGGMLCGVEDGVRARVGLVFTLARGNF